jgi:ABC-type branched-subunit amino acid transport system ATPase component
MSRSRPAAPVRRASLKIALAGALALADRAYVIEGGRIVASGAATELAAEGALERAYLGAGAA